MQNAELKSESRVESMISISKEEYERLIALERTLYLTKKVKQIC